MLEGESVIGESVIRSSRGKPCLWYGEDPVVLPSSSARAHKGLLRPLLKERTFEDWKDLIRRKMGSGDGNLHIYVSQPPPPWSTQNLVRRNEFSLSMLHAQFPT